MRVAAVKNISYIIMLEFMQILKADPIIKTIERGR